MVTLAHRIFYLYRKPVIVVYINLANDDPQSAILGAHLRSHQPQSQGLPLHPVRTGPGLHLGQQERSEPLISEDQ